MTPADTVARTIWGEARSTGQTGMQAVANVIANRERNPRWWGQNWVDVCTARAQFSCWNLDDPNRPKLLSVTDQDPEFRIALDLAEQAIAETLPDLTSNADHYHALGVASPSWARDSVPVYRDAWQVFYRLELPPLLNAAKESAPPMTPAPINVNTTQGTAGLAVGAAGAAVVLFSGVLQHYGLVLSPDQTSALTALLTVIFHPLGVLFLGGDTPAPADPPKPPAL